VILVHGTFANMDDNWQAASPLLGTTNPVRRIPWDALRASFTSRKTP